MSTISVCKCKCSVCGVESKQTVLMSTNAFGAPDLDLRPPEMKRSTMAFWIQECPNCGYISDNIDDETGVNKEFLSSEKYCSCSKIHFGFDLAEQFYKSYLIKLFDAKVEEAFYAILAAAWSCDDAGDEENAIYCRKLAVAELEKMIGETDNATLKVQKADLLRRAGLFDAVIKEYSDSDLEDETLNKIIAFQIEKSKQEDMSCYTVEDVIGTDD